MACSQRNCVLALLLLAAVCVELYQAQHSVGRCSCLSPSVKFIKANITDFQVLEKRPGCDKTEFVVTITNPDNSTVTSCVNTQGRMAQAFLKCWERINKDESRKMECIEKKRKAEERT